MAIIEDQRRHAIAPELREIKARLDSIDKRMEGFDKRMDGFDKRMDGLERLMEAGFGEVKAGILTTCKITWN